MADFPDFDYIAMKQMPDNFRFIPTADLALPTSLLNKHAALGSAELRAASDLTFPYRHFAFAELPDLVALAGVVRMRLEGADGAALVDCTCLEHCGIEIQKFALITICSLLGTPTSINSNRLSTIWHVTPQIPELAGPKPMISQTDHEAELHTDSAHRERPERYVALFAVHPADDGGGETQLVDGEEALSQLRLTVEGKRHETVLRARSLPIKTPDAISPQQVRILRAPLLSDKPMIRYRNDLIESGFAAIGESPCEDLTAALFSLRSAIDRSRMCQFTLRRGEVLFLNNHRLLHGRTGFKDKSRLLLRVRMHC